MSTDRLLLGYSQLPTNYSMEMSNASKEKLDILESKLTNAVKGGVPNILFVEGTAQPIYSILRKTVNISDIWGINFSEYFKSIFDKEKEKYQVSFKPYIFIYNVGLEPAVNTGFSSKLLKSLIKDFESKNCWIFLESDLPFTKFYTQYGLEVVNRIVIPLKKYSNFL